MKNGTLFLGLILGLLLLNSSKPCTNDSNPPKTRLDSLMSKKWINQMTNQTETYHKDTMVLKWDSHTFDYIYYLTDDISKIGVGADEGIANFDWSKVGKSVKGKFLVALTIIKPGKYGVCYTYEIVELTDNRLVLRRASHTGEWVAAPDKVFVGKPLD